MIAAISLWQQSKLYMSKRLKRSLLHISYPLALGYWFIWRPKTFGAKVIITCGDEILLIRHSYASNNWTFSGGGIEKGETPEQAATRELKEELDIDILQTPTLLGTVKSNREYKHDTVYVLTVNLDLETKQRITIDEVEITEAKWFPLTNLPTLSEINAEIFSKYGAL